MTTVSRIPITNAGFVFVLLLGAGCDGLFNFSDHQLVSQPPPQPPDGSTEDGASYRCRAVTVDPALDYEAMCRHYCDTLEESSRYLSLSRGEMPADAGSVSSTCYELRCAPKCVDLALCLTQCDGAGQNYAAVCAAADAGADEAVCPETPEDHVAACRAGCRPPLPPPGDPAGSGQAT
jgi:hypothetical protein